MSDQSIIYAIQKLAGTHQKDDVKLLQCTVKSVDLDGRTCTVSTITGNSQISFDVQLMAGVADGLLIEPALDSMVYVLMSKYSLPFIVQYSDVVKYLFNGDEFGGLVKVIELTGKLNAIEQKVNSIITWGAGVTPPFVGEPLVPTQQTEIENTSVNHGS